MTAIATRLYRLVLFAYPAQFRRSFGAEMVRLQMDQYRHEARSAWRILLEETVDAGHAAPRMRWESPMGRIVILAVAGAVALGAMIFAQLALIPLALLGLAAWFAWGRPLQPLASASASRRWAAWLIAGGVAIATAIAIPAIDGGELNEVWWTVMMLSLLGGAGMAIVGGLLAISGRAHRLSSTRGS